jgi:hypothetical protein
MRLERTFAKFRSWQLLLLTGTLFVIDLVVPDPIPFVDEAILGLVTLLLARKKRS